jgi:hypothetical protein
MKLLFAVSVFVFFFTNAIAQNTQEEGTVFLGGGIGKSWSFSPTFNFNNGVKTKSSLSDNILAPQWSAKVGYVFANHFAIDFNAERFLWNYNATFPLTNDILYARLGVFGMDKLYKTNKSEFAITGLAGVGGGLVFSNNSLNNNIVRFEKNAFNGFGATANAGLRFEFHKRIYLLLEQTGGIIYQSVKGENTSIDLSQFYLRTNLSIGVFIYERWNESCNTCPKW